MQVVFYPLTIDECMLIVVELEPLLSVNRGTIVNDLKEPMLDVPNGGRWGLMLFY